MRTFKDIMNQLTGPAMLTDLTELLRTKDPGFPPVEQNYLNAFSAAKSIWDALSYSILCQYMEAWFQTLIPRLVYAGYLGFQVNLENFRNPAGMPVHRMDFSELIKEHIATHLPASQSAVQAAHEYYQKLRSQSHDLPDAVKDYCAYLETAAPNLAHFAGYVIANEFLQWVEPGYKPDGYQTATYVMRLDDYLGCHPFPESKL